MIRQIAKPLHPTRTGPVVDLDRNQRGKTLCERTFVEIGCSGGKGGGGAMAEFG